MQSNASSLPIIYNYFDITLSCYATTCERDVSYSELCQ